MKIIRPLAWLACLTSLMSALTSAADMTAVVKDGRINVRGQPSLVGEVITQLQQGEKVVVLEEIATDKSKTNEPPKWFRIQMPANTPVWLFAPFIDPASKSVKVSRLNLRAGPGENYSVVGRLERGATISEIRRVEDWMEVETPKGAYAFVAANLVSPGDAKMTAAKPETVPPKLMASKPLPTSPVPEPTKMTNAAIARADRAANAPKPESTPPRLISNPPITDAANTNVAPKIATAPNIPKVESTPLPVISNPPATYAANSHIAPKPLVATPPMIATATATAPRVGNTNRATVAVQKPKVEETLQRRVVRREGLVRSTVSIQAPTYYELLNPENRKTINYLHADRLALNLKDYQGRRIIVTGEEAIDPRWPKTPLIEVETLELIP